MTQDINLLNPDLFPAPQRLSLRGMGVVLAAAVVLSGIFSGWWLMQADDARLAHAAAAKRHQTSRDAMTQALAAVKPAQPAAVIEQEIALLQGQLTARRVQFDKLNEGLLDPGRRYSSLMRLLALQTPTGIWLTEVEIDREVTVSGYALQAPVLRDWMDRISTAPYFAGMPPGTLRAERERVALGSLAPVSVAGAAPAPAAAAAAAGAGDRLRFRLGTGALGATRAGS